MDYDVKKKIFSSFFSTKGSKKGTGLGLLTTRKIVHEHGGRVSFDSIKGKSSVFRLEFPRSLYYVSHSTSWEASGQGGDLRIAR